MTSSLPSSDQHQSRADARDLHALGYAQTLFRTMGSKKGTPCGAMISTAITRVLSTFRIGKL